MVETTQCRLGSLKATCPFSSITAHHRLQLAWTPSALCAAVLAALPCHYFWTEYIQYCLFLTWYQDVCFKITPYLNLTISASANYYLWSLSINRDAPIQFFQSRYLCFRYRPIPGTNTPPQYQNLIHYFLKLRCVVCVVVFFFRHVQVVDGVERNKDIIQTWNWFE